MNDKAQRSILNFENNENTIESLQVIKKEFIRNSKKVLLSLISMAGAYLIYFSFIYQTFGSFPKPLNNSFIIEQITAWSFFILYLFSHFFVLTYIRFSPSLIRYLKYELNNMGFELKKKYKISMSFFLVNSLLIPIFLISYLSVIYIEDFILQIVAIRSLIIYIFIIITYPIIRGLMHSRFIVKLTKGHYIQIHLQFRIIKPKGLEPQSIRIFLSSNRLCFKFNNEKKIIYNNITETRWLPKSGRKILPIFSLNPYLYFHEFAIPINLQTQIYNLVGAIRDWDLSFKPH
ncbi:MAG: hypothetical protein ACW98X_18670 [Promethearchaeota archaeon]|jgi:hypothetical protein